MGVQELVAVVLGRKETGWVRARTLAEFKSAEQTARKPWIDEGDQAVFPFLV
jgi:hypothetical protein